MSKHNSKVCCTYNRFKAKLKKLTYVIRLFVIIYIIFEIIIIKIKYFY